MSQPRSASSSPNGDAPILVGADVRSTPFQEPVRPDELLFDCTATALRQAGLRKSDVDLAIVASLDLYDGLSMSNVFTNGAAAGWLTGEYRIEGDSAVALESAVAALRSGDSDVAVVAGLHAPQIAAAQRLQFDQQVSNLCFDPIYERRLGVTAAALYAIHTRWSIDQGQLSAADLATIAAEEICRGAENPRGGRTKAVSESDVAASTLVASPLTELMLPPTTGGAVVLVLAAPDRAAHCRQRRARLAASATVSGPSIASQDWLSDPAGPAARASDKALTRAGLTRDAVTTIEMTAATPALVRPMTAALGADGLSPADVNPSGGARSWCPGVANGALRLIEAVERMESHGQPGDYALVHSTEMVTGPVGANTTVWVVQSL